MSNLLCQFWFLTVTVTYFIKFANDNCGAEFTENTFYFDMHMDNTEIY